MDFFLPVISKDLFHENFRRVLLKNDQLAQALFNQWANGFVDRDNKIIKRISNIIQLNILGSLSLCSVEKLWLRC